MIERSVPRPPYIRWMIRRDLPEVLEIERQSFECPWQADDFKKMLSRRDAIGMVAVDDSTFEAVLGYIVYVIHPTALELVNFAVHPEERRRGVGHAMFAKLASKLAPDKRTEIAFQVVDTNLDAQLFFKAVGCRATGVLHSVWLDGDDDSNTPEIDRDAYRFVCQVREAVTA